MPDDDLHWQTAPVDMSMEIMVAHQSDIGTASQESARKAQLPMASSFVYSCTHFVGSALALGTGCRVSPGVLA